jgi:ABC-type amino acid transport substrate-binding protein
MRQSHSLQKIYLLLIFAILISQVFVPANSFSQKIRDAKIEIEKPERISVAYCADCVPFHFKDELGQPAGILIDIWRLWSEKTGIALDFRVAPWDETLARVGSGVVDVHAGLFFNKERDQFLDYGAALRKTDTHVFIHKSLPAISRLEELSAYRIGVLAEDYVEGYLKKRLPKAIVIPYPDYASIMMALKDGTLRVFAADTPSGIYHLQHSGLVERFSFTKELLLYQNDWYAAAKEGNAALIKIINQGMSQISKLERSEVGRRWAGITKEKKTDALLISMDRAYPPMTFLNAQGKPAGFLVDLWRLWSEKTGRSIRFRENNWEDSIAALRSGEADVHAGLFKNEERKQWLEFVPEVYRIRTGMYHRAGEKLSQGSAQFRGTPLGVIAGTHQETIARSRWPDSQLIPPNLQKIQGEMILAKQKMIVLSQRGQTLQSLLIKMVRRILGLGRRIPLPPRISLIHLMQGHWGVIHHRYPMYL